ncbi:MAG: type II secretion system F family protein [Candidatus Omnitrophica bacterium]|nr:type II secretion system F family protein [Candidatus Omnitrophota bacterium]
MKFIYQAKKGLNEVIEGVIEAQTQEQALKKLTDQGLFPMNITPYSSLTEEKTSPQRPKATLTWMPKKITAKDILIFTQKLTTLIKAKVELLQSLRILHEQTENHKLKETIMEIYNETKEGKVFSESLKKFPKTFSPLYVNIVKSGEASGRLDKALIQINEFLQNQQTLRTKIGVALAYPAMLALVGCASILVLMNFVVPKLRGIFSELETELPLLTKIIFESSSFLQKGSIWIFLAAAVSFSLIYYKGGSTYLNRILRKIKANLPIVRRLVKNQELIHFTRSFNLLLRSGVPALQSLQIVTPTIDDEKMQSQLAKVCQDVASGSSVSKSMHIHTSLPDFFIKMVTVGEESGRLEEVLDEILYSYSQQVEADISVITSLLEPILILILGLILGAIVLSILLPIFEITQIVQ